MTKLRIGVIGLQGAVSEHLKAITKALAKLHIKGEAVWVSRPSQLERISGVIIPGGESTTIGKLMVTTGLFERVKEKAEGGMPVFGTCAGLIILAKRGDEQVARTKQPLLGLMDMSVIRNAFGRQRESFEVDLGIPPLGAKPFRCVFIRAPAVQEVWGGVEVWAKFRGKIVAVKQQNLLATAFHPELTDDLRFHEHFIQICQEASFG